MKTRKNLTMTGVAVAIAATGGPLAIAGIDAGGSPIKTGGSITQFGSIYVNGARYDTSDALFIIDGRLGDESELHIGQVVSLYGSIDEAGDSGVAWLVYYDDDIEGPVASVDAAAGRMTVLGQTVLVDETTAFALASGAQSLDALTENDSVAVSGFSDADGNLLATWIGDAGGAASQELTARVTAADPDGLSFAINGLIVDYGAANLYDFASGAPDVGDFVEIAGTLDSASGRFLAGHVWSAAGTAAAATDSRGALEGYVTARPGLTRFEIDGQPVQLSWSTDYENGWFFDLGLNARVEVEGHYDADGALIAERIEFEAAPDVLIDGTVDAVIDDVVYVDGMALRVTPETAFEDDSDSDERRFGAGNLDAGDQVAIQAYSSGGEMIATRLERDD